MNYWMTFQNRNFLKVDELIDEIRAGKITEDRLSVKKNRKQVQKGDKGFMIAGEKGDRPRAVYATFVVLEAAAEPMLDPHPQFLVKPKGDEKMPRALIRYDSCCLPIPCDCKMPQDRPGTRKMREVGEELYERMRMRIKQGE